MKNTSKGRICATSVPVSDGAPLSQIFNYNANPVTFRTIDGALMVNATQMAKPFGKAVYEWLRLPSTKAYVMALIDVRLQKVNKGLSRIENRKPLNERELRTNKFVIAKKGGRSSGTYLHEDIAIEFARWLSPAFAVWCNDRIKELFRQRVTQQTAQEQPQPHAPQVMTIDDVLGRLREATDLVTALKQERAERERLEAVLMGIKKQLDGLHSKSERIPILLPTLF